MQSGGVVYSMLRRFGEVPMLRLTQLTHYAQTPLQPFVRSSASQFAGILWFRQAAVACSQ